VPGTGSFSSRRAVVDPRSVRSSLLPSCAVASACRRIAAPGRGHASADSKLRLQLYRLAAF
jgi:hypothetical protein